jgi:predicted nucleic acid-binding protein
MIILLDTTVLIDVLRNRGNRRALLADFVEQGHTLATAAINIGEVYAGMRPHEATETDRFLGSVESYPTTGAIARHAGMLKSAYGQKRKPLSLPDMIVAATALAHGASLMTDNRKDFPLPDLTFVPTS